jgi:hypothetical protein
MVRRMFVTGAIAIVMAALVAACGGPTFSVSHQVSASVASAGDLSGTWYGSFGQFAASLYEDEGKSILRINEDGTFTGTVTRSLGTNNLAKPASWSGTVMSRGNRVILRNTVGSWPSIILTRSGENTLYGLATDPAIEAPVMMKFEREDTGG